MSGEPTAERPAQTPYLRGFDVKWWSCQWGATSRSEGRFVIRGRDADELLRKRDAVYKRELGELRQVLDTVPVVGHPPRGQQPTRRRNETY